MTQQQKNRIKALFLLIVFSLHTIIGFACSVGVDMGYNSKHHAHGKIHSHVQGKNDLDHHHLYHNHHTNTKLSANSNITNPKDDCCSNEVTKFSLMDKSVFENFFNIQTPVFLLYFISIFFSSTLHETRVAVNSRFQFVRRSCFLNDIDLRIAIQSFQI